MKAFTSLLVVGLSAAGAAIRIQWGIPKDQDEALAVQNASRSKVNHIQIHYNETLALDAQEKSNSLAAADVDPVAVDSEARKNEGENVYWAWGNITGVGYVSAAEWFCAEASRYTAGGIVDDDMNGEWYKWGHWSQVVWPTTTSMGMGAAISASGKVYITFRYWPQGNSIGQGPLP